MPEIARMTERWYDRISRVTGHQFLEGDRKPLIFYADDADFRQTNIVPGFIPGGVRGLTEPLRERVVMPLTPDHNVTHHVLGHELVHSFQFDYSIRAGVNIQNLPLWLVEGMAEYYTLGRTHTQTAMWMRDAVLIEELPSFGDLPNQARFNPYRYGHALLAYVGGRFGDEAVMDYFRVAGVSGTSAAIDSVFDMSADELAGEWHEALRDHYLPLAEGRTPADQMGERILAEELGHGRLNLAPSVSPDGRYVAYLAESIPVGIDLQVADAETGSVVANLGGVAAEPHLDDIRFLNSGGTWDPESRRVAFVTFSGGDNELAIWNINRGRIERSIRLPGVPALENPSWSPDGSRIAVSGIIGSVSNLYIYDLDEGTLEQVTDDLHSALQPQWSPDGTRLVYVTDSGPGGTDLEQLDIRQHRIAMLDLRTGERSWFAPFGEATYSNPHFSPDGQSLYFISDPDGFQDIYRFHLQAEELFRVTSIQTGITGVTENSPALSVSREAGTIMFSVFSGDRYAVARMDEEEAQGDPVPILQADPFASARILPPSGAAGQNIIAGYMADPGGGLLPAGIDFKEEDHERRFALTGVMQPQIGVGVGGFGTQVMGGVGFMFTDLLGDHNLGVALEARGTFRDIGGQLSYINRRYRVNYGGMVGRFPQVFASAFVSPDPDTGDQILNRVIERMYIDQASLISELPLSETQRLEATAGVSRYSFDRRVEQYILNPFGQVIGEEQVDLPDPDNLYFGSGSLAYVIDFSFSGFTSPIEGGRSRFEVSPILGSAQFVNLLTDGRRYLFADPLTLAARIMHRGNYGAETGEPFSTEYLGFAYSPTYVRGYSFGSFRPAECPPGRETCPAMDRLVGTHVAVANLEVRIPLLGTEQFGLIPFRWLPMELSFFADGGMAWTAETPPVLRFERDSMDRIPVFSTGVSTRFNILGALILELYYAHPFQRPDRGAHIGFQLMPGW